MMVGGGKGISSDVRKICSRLSMIKSTQLILDLEATLVELSS